MKKQNARFSARRLVFAGLCAAVGVVLPMLIHGIPGGGKVLLPMHIPVLLCGILCGPWYGLACGVIAPVVSSLATGMPPAAILPGMVCELAVYGLVSGIAYARLPLRKPAARTWAALVIAMLSGRVAAGLVNGLIFMAGRYSLQAWVTASFVTALPGILIQLVLIPALVFALQKAGVRAAEKD